MPLGKEMPLSGTTASGLIRGCFSPFLPPAPGFFREESFFPTRVCSPDMQRPTQGTQYLLLREGINVGEQMMTVMNE